MSDPDRPVRVRMAPSPTGYFHVGSARTALYNWIVARQHEGGVFVLRVEDTDAERHVEEASQAILESMRWLGLDWDEGPYYQSERKALYADAVARLAASDHTYFCACTRDEIDARAKERGGPPGYDGHCRDLGLEAGPGRAMRFRTPKGDGAVVVPDVIRGNPSFAWSTIEDFVVARADGSALFILANVVDDIDMRMSHVIRGEDHLTNTAKYLLLWDALDGGPQPVFAHLPMLVNEKRQKLSKRRDRVFIGDFQADGYLASAMVNYLALLGWAPGDDRELLTMDDLVRDFRLESVVSSPAFFDLAKLRHINGEHIRALSAADFTAAAQAFVPAEWDLASLGERLLTEVRDRTFLLSEVPALVDFLFLSEIEFDEQAWNKQVAKDAASSAAVLDAAAELYAGITWEAAALHEGTAALAERMELKLNRAQAPVRVAVTGRSVGPPLFESLEVLGRERTLARIETARARLG